MTNINIGDIVEGHYNSGVYVGKVIEDRGNLFLIEVLAVKEHPDQGDLHNPGQVEGIAFFERKALAYTEKINISKRKVYPYEGEVPNYSESLKQAVVELKEKLNAEDTLFNKTSMEKLLSVEEHFYKKTDY